MGRLRWRGAGQVFGLGLARTQARTLAPTLARSLTLAGALMSLGAVKDAIPPALAWAYPVAPAGTPPTDEGPGPFKTPAGTLVTRAQLDAMGQNLPDWAPSQHPPAPPIIRHVTRKDGPAPCAECHGMAGAGLVTLPDLAGLPAPYIVEQLHAFRSGQRRSSQPGWLATNLMINEAKAVTDDEMGEAARYFAATPRRARIQVIESDFAPATRMERFGWLYRAGSGRQPLNGQVIEVPGSLVQMAMYDPALTQIVYAPRGAIARGEALVQSGGAAGQPCASCHGAGLKGLGLAPPLAGRDPSYLARMLWDIHSGARGGPPVALMQAPARGLTPRQITEVSVYLASLKP
ncbi:MAG: c-type cytochrome [Alphaproteobacteria bacterium]|nr:c-type cytochrome [Alphaproteobacteria bacterium]